MTKKNIYIIVAKYNEEISWTKQFENVIIYNKGKNLDDSYNYVNLDNVGREGHTYYKYICDNYENLPEYMIFLQGHPFDHSPNIIKDINTYINKEELNIDFEFLSKKIHQCKLSGCKFKPTAPLRKVYNQLFDEKKEDMKFIFGAGAQFIVSKKAVLKRSKEFYSKIVELLSYNSDPIEGHVIERFHKLIFDP